MRKPFDFPITAVYFNEGFLIAPRSAKLAIWQILCFWWINESKALPDEQGLLQISGLRETEWKRHKKYIETALAGILPVLQSDYSKKEKKRKLWIHNAHLGQMSQRKRRAQARMQEGNIKGLTDSIDTHSRFTAIQSPSKHFHEGMSDESQRAVAKASMANKTGEKVWFRDK